MSKIENGAINDPAVDSQVDTVSVALGFPSIETRMTFKDFVDQQSVGPRNLARSDEGEYDVSGADAQPGEQQKRRSIREDCVMNELDLEESSLFRLPDWRWQFARWQARKRRWQPDGKTPRWLMQAVEYLREKRCSRFSDLQPTLDRRFPLLAGAIRIRRDRGSCWEVEARILARQSDQEIAARCGLTADAVAMFERLFFCTRDLLAARDRIFLDLIGLGAAWGFRRSQTRRLLRFIGYTAGPVMLDAVLALAREGNRRAFGGFRLPPLVEQPAPFLDPLPAPLREALTRWLYILRRSKSSARSAKIELVLVEQLAVLERVRHAEGTFAAPLEQLAAVGPPSTGQYRSSDSAREPVAVPAELEVPQAIWAA